MKRYFVTWQETVIRSTYVDAADDAAAVVAGKAYVESGGDGSYEEFAGAEEFYAEEA